VTRLNRPRCLIHSPALRKTTAKPFSTHPLCVDVIAHANRVGDVVYGFRS